MYRVVRSHCLDGYFPEIERMHQAIRDQAKPGANAVPTQGLKWRRGRDCAFAIHGRRPAGQLPLSKIAPSDIVRSP